jgi:hypothetical protein
MKAGGDPSPPAPISDDSDLDVYLLNGDMQSVV